MQHEGYCSQVLALISYFGCLPACQCLQVYGDECSGSRQLAPHPASHPLPLALQKQPALGALPPAKQLLVDMLAIVQQQPAAILTLTGASAAAEGAAVSRQAGAGAGATGVGVGPGAQLAAPARPPVLSPSPLHMHVLGGGRPPLQGRGAATAGGRFGKPSGAHSLITNSSGETGCAVSVPCQQVYMTCFDFSYSC